MKRFLLASLGALLIVGCGGSGSSSAPALPPLAGEYNGRWNNVQNAADDGISTWIIEDDGTFQSYEAETQPETLFLAEGTIDAVGNVRATIRNSVTDEGVPFTGRLQRDAQGVLRGELTWGSVPPRTCRYILTRHIPE